MTAPEKDAESIRSQRAGSNDAIARQDIDALASYWTPDIQTTSSMGRQLSGKPAHVAFYKAQLSARPDTWYLRTPDQVNVLPPWDVAMECGEWLGRWSEASGAVQVSGRYMAQWRRIGARWLIHGELYVPTAFTGPVSVSIHALAQEP